MTVSIEGTTPGIAVDGTGAVVNVTVTTGAGGGGGGVALGETSTTAYRGDRGKTAYDHSQVTTGNPHGTTAADVGADPAGTAAGLVDDLSGVSNQATARTNLGLGTAATAATGDFAATSHTHTGTQVTVDASGFNGNLTTSDDTVQEVAQKLDDLVIPAAGIADPGGANDDFLQRKSGAWTYRTPAQVQADLGVVAEPVFDSTNSVMSTGDTYLSQPGPYTTNAYFTATGRAQWVAVYAPAGTYDRIGINITAGNTSTLRLYIDSVSATTGAPSTYIVDAGTISTVSTGLIEATISWTNATNRWVWLRVQCDAYTSTATMTALNAASGCQWPLWGGFPAGNYTPVTNRAVCGLQTTAQTTGASRDPTTGGNGFVPCDASAVRVFLRRAT